MRTRSVVTAVAILACTAASASELVACANDDGTPADTSDASATQIAPDAAPTSDASSDAEADAGETSPDDTCVPTALCPNGPFAPTMPDGGLDVRTRINTIRGRSPTDVWAAGVNGSVAHFDGTTWTTSDTGTDFSMKGLWLRDEGEIALASLSAIFTHGVDDAGAPSAGGWVAHGMPTGPFDIYMSANRISSAWTAPGAEWLFFTTLETPPPQGPGMVNGLWRLHVVAGTNALEISNAVPSNTCSVLPCKQMTAIHGATADDVWAVGYTGAAVHITDAQGTQPKIVAFDSRTWSPLNGVWAASTDDVWAVGGQGVVRHYTGKPTAWDIVTDVPATEALNAVWGSSSTDVWAVGDGATVLHYDGTRWSRVKVAGLGDRKPDLYSVWTPSPGHVWVGGDGVLLSLGGTP